MSLNSKVIWSEGMFLSSQHFQQQERYFERLVDGKCSAFGAYGWGMHDFDIDQQLLTLGKISISRGSGVCFPIERLLTFQTWTKHHRFIRFRKIHTIVLFIYVCRLNVPERWMSSPMTIA